MIRPYQGVQTIGAASQPVFGTALTAAITPTVDPHTGTNRPGTTPPPVIISVTSTVGILEGDSVAVGPKGNFTTANRSKLDHGVVASIISATQMSVNGLLQSHAATGEYVVLDEVASTVHIIPVSTTAQIFLGTDSTVSGTDLFVFDVIAKVASTAEPTYWHQSLPAGRSDSYQTSQYWLDGTQNDTFLARFTQI